MPLWRIFSHPDTFNFTQREALAKDVTALYVSGGLPAFYVNVIFIDVDEKAVFVGGKPRKDFVRIVIEQIARVLPEERRTWWMDQVGNVLKPHLHARPELDFETHVYETPRDLWRVQDIDPPPPFSQAEKRWKSEDTASTWKWVGEGAHKAAL